MLKIWPNLGFLFFKGDIEADSVEIWYASTSVKSLMFACPIFHELHKLNKTAKLKGANIDTIPTLIGIVCCLEIVLFEFAIMKGAKVILHVKSQVLGQPN